MEDQLDQYCEGAKFPQTFSTIKLGLEQLYLIVKNTGS
jgi:hypothetical protein